MDGSRGEKAGYKNSVITCWKITEKSINMELLG